MMMNPTRLCAILLLTLSSQYAIAADTTAISPTVGFVQITAALGFILLLMFGAAWLLKRLGPITTGNKLSLKIVGGISVGNRERIVVVEVDDQWLVLGVTANNINQLASMPKKDVPAVPNTQSSGVFQDWLKRTIEKRSDAPNE
ncbi:flagellar biosynthetic protein FliO [Undibacterium sp. SXout20W]|uniref:flagellar biosynthetic protein FliO n=1 Tax=Undibacterium sp. SXout20W TaxID=3413051 RepID=UPI003BF55A5C